MDPQHGRTITNKYIMYNSSAIHKLVFIFRIVLFCHGFFLEQNLQKVRLIVR